MKKIQALENNPLLNLQKKGKNFEIYGPAKDDDNKKSKKKKIVRFKTEGFLI